MKYVIMSLTADKLAAQNKASSKVAKRVVPAYRRLFSISQVISVSPYLVILVLT